MARQQSHTGRGKGRGGRGGRSGRTGRGRGRSSKKQSGARQTKLFSNQSSGMQGRTSNTHTPNAEAGTADRNASPAKKQPTQSPVDTNQPSTPENKSPDTEQKNSEGEEEAYEEEDDLNTINSDETSKRGRNEQSKKVPPRFIRYQLMIKMDNKNKDSPINLEEDDQEKTPTQKLRDILSIFYNQMRVYDARSRLISWSVKSEFSIMGDEFPQDVAETAIYFSGFRVNMNTQKRIYLRLCIHTPQSNTVLHQKISSWCKLYGYSITKCVVQAENSTCIGWLCYSSQYTDTEPLKLRLMDESNFEWGFRLISVNDKQNSLPWNKRLKAVGVFVPTEAKDIALQVIGEELEAELNDPITIPDFTDKFLFIEPQWTTKGNKSREMYYADMLKRHVAHIESLRAEISFGISADLDRSFNYYKEFSISVRDIILDLCVGDKNNEFHGDRLFHSVDYVSDSSNLWIDNRNGPGGPCVVFTYYKDVVTEASTMIKGLGKFVVHQYDKQLAAKMFHSDHFKANKGYRWNEEMNRFSTPNIRRMIANVENDNNLSAIKKLQKQMELRLAQEKKEQEEQLKKENLVEGAMLINLGDEEQEGEDKEGDKENASINNNSVPSNVHEDIQQEQFKKMRQGVRDPDLNSINDEGSEYKNKPETVDIGDAGSVNSSITNNTNNSLESIDTNISGTTIGTNNVSLTKPPFIIDMNMIDVIAKGTEAITEDELRRQVHAMQVHKYNEAIVNTQNLVEKYISARKESTPTITSNKQQSSNSKGQTATPSSFPLPKGTTIYPPSTQSSNPSPKESTDKNDQKDSADSDNEPNQHSSPSTSEKSKTKDTDTSTDMDKAKTKSHSSNPNNNTANGTESQVKGTTKDSSQAGSKPSTSPTSVPKTKSDENGKTSVNMSTPANDKDSEVPSTWSDVVKQNTSLKNDKIGKSTNQPLGLMELEKQTKADDDPQYPALPTPKNLFKQKERKNETTKKPKQNVRRSKRNMSNPPGASASHTGKKP